MPLAVVVGVALLIMAAVVVLVLVARGRASLEAEDRLAQLAAAEDDEDANPIVKLARRVVEDAYARGAESIHVGLAEKSACVRYRVDGALEERMQLPGQALPPLFARFARMAGLPPEAKGPLEEGTIVLRRWHDDERAPDLDLGVARWRAADGERWVLRLLAKGAIALDLEALDLSADDAARLRRAAASKQGGLILVAGGVRSGRTTTLHALRHELAAGRAVADVARDEHVPWIEGVDASNLSSLDADVVVVNDLDSPEVARVALEAAQGGRLVLASIFADDVGVALSRLAEDFGASRHVLGACLRAVVAQRLCRRLCAACPSGAPSAGCERCKGTGYKGRVALYEVAAVTGELLAAVRSGETSPAALSRAAVAGGMTTLADDGARKVALGRTDLALS